MEHELFTVQQDIFLVRMRCYLPQTDWETLQGEFEKIFNSAREIYQFQKRLKAITSKPSTAIFQLYLEKVTRELAYKQQLDPSFAHMKIANFWKPKIMDSEEVEVVVSGRSFEQVRSLYASLMQLTRPIV